MAFKISIRTLFLTFHFLCSMSFKFRAVLRQVSDCLFVERSNTGLVNFKRIVAAAQEKPLHENNFATDFGSGDRNQILTPLRGHSRQNLWSLVGYGRWNSRNEVRTELIPDHLCGTTQLRHFWDLPPKESGLGEEVGPPLAGSRR